MVMIIP